MGPARGVQAILDTRTSPGGHAAAKHLLTLGHRRIACLGGTVHAGTNQARLHGFRSTMEAAGAPVPDELVRHAGTFHAAEGIEHGAPLLAVDPAPTAVFAASDELAAGLIEAARLRGPRVPDDRSIVGFDNTPLAQATSPPLTTIHGPVQEMGTVALRTALRLAAAETSTPITSNWPPAWWSANRPGPCRQPESSLPPSGNEAPPPMATPAPYDLTIDFGGDRFPVSGPRPRLSWKPPTGIPAYTDYELELHVEGRAPVTARTDEHLYVDWPTAPLTSGDRVHWRVRTQTSRWSGGHDFDAGLLDEDWSAHWITPADDPQHARLSPGTRRARILRTTFTTAEVVRARLYSTALGVYEAFVNGARGHRRTLPGLHVVRPHPVRPGRRRHLVRPRRDRAVRRLVPRPGRRRPQTGRLG
ncbi:substrate-binding domain-containing protein [Streptomyces sp. NPDC059262]|uniref:substrate-binding domain-containing protein n=1 Tax=Streptomyces sp. NPDC059262 TaxID=3346797 RepID=UPI0036A50A4A